MKRMIVVAVAMAAMLALALAGPARAEAGIQKLAKQECKEERTTDRAEFVARYGGTGKAAKRRCIKHEKRDARRECKQDLRERDERAEFKAHYNGTGKAAIKRCVADELREN